MDMPLAAVAIYPLHRRGTVAVRHHLAAESGTIFNN